MIENGEFIQYYQSLIQLFFDIRKQYGCHQTKLEKNTNGTLTNKKIV